MRASCVAGLVVVLLAGCGESKGDKLMKTNLRLINAMAGEFELLTTKPAAEEIPKINKRLDQYKGEMKEVNQALQKMSIGEARALGEKYETELTQAKDRLGKAMYALVPKNAPAKKGPPPPILPKP